MSTSDDQDSPAGEVLMLTIKECFVYKVPPLRSASGHRAEDWNLATPMYTGCLRVYQCDTKLRILLYAYKDANHQVMDDEHLQFLGQCPIEVQYGESIVNFVDAVIDSSRYYVLRIKDPKSTRSMLLGVGFRERDQAFDFKNCLNEYIKFIDRMHLANMLQSGAHHHHDGTGSSGGGGGGGNAAQQEEDEMDGYHSMKGHDLHHKASEEAMLLHLDEHITPLKDGEKIKVKLNLNHNTKKTSHDNMSLSSSSSDSSAASTPKLKSAFGLKPPPPPGSTVFACADEAVTQQAQPAANEDEDWGDFTSS